MRSAASLLRFALLSCLLAPACEDGGDDSADPRIDEILMLNGDAANGQMRFDATGCALAACHGTTGNDGMAPMFMNTVPTLNDEGLVDRILNGGELMPPQGNNLENQEVADLVQWLRDNFS